MEPLTCFEGSVDLLVIVIIGPRGAGRAREDKKVEEHDVKIGDRLG